MKFKTQYKTKESINKRILELINTELKRPLSKRESRELFELKAIYKKLTTTHNPYLDQMI